MKPPNLYLLVLRVSDLERSEHFYSAFGYQISHEKHGNGPAHISVKAGSLILELYPVSSTSGATSGARLGFEVEDTSTVLQALVKAGGTLIQPIRDVDWGKCAVVADPDGHKIELLEI